MHYIKSENDFALTKRILAKLNFMAYIFKTIINSILNYLSSQDFCFVAIEESICLILNTCNVNFPESKFPLLVSHTLCFTCIGQLRE